MLQYDLAQKRGHSNAIAWCRRLPELPLAGFGFLLHFVWEMLQIPWYEGMPETSHGAGVWICTRATGGDVVILLTGFWMASLLAGGRDWFLYARRLPAVVMVTAGVLITIVLERLATGALERWTYADAMPVVPVAGIGLAPLLQWLLLPPLILWLARRHVLGNETLQDDRQE